APVRALNREGQFVADGEIAFAHSVPGVGRFRANVFRQRGAVSMVFRKLGMGGPTFEAIGLPPIVQKLSDEARGLLLATGPTGSGKTTTPSAMSEPLNRTRAGHIVTIQDPSGGRSPARAGPAHQRGVAQEAPRPTPDP